VGYSMGDDEAFRRSASERIDGRYQIEVQFEQREFVMIELMEKCFVFSMGGGEGSGGQKFGSGCKRQSLRTAVGVKQPGPQCTKNTSLPAA
jgi:hypothetical protein